MRLKFTILLCILFAFATAQTRGVAQNAIPGDNNHLGIGAGLGRYCKNLQPRLHNSLRFAYLDLAYIKRGNQPFVYLGSCYNCARNFCSIGHKL